MKKIKFFIDDKECIAEENETITSAARRNNIFIPTLCDFEGLKPAGTCRICTVKINGEYKTACNTIAEEKMIVECNTPEMIDIHKAIIELLMVEGNHQCSICEKSGDCVLQALGYKYQILVPRFSYLYPVRKIETQSTLIQLDMDRCIQCMRCVRGVKDSQGKSIFKLNRKGGSNNIEIIPGQENNITVEIAKKAFDICPTGAILGRGEGYKTPIGERTYDTHSIDELEK